MHGEIVVMKGSLAENSAFEIVSGVLLYFKSCSIRKVANSWIPTALQVEKRAGRVTIVVLLSLMASKIEGIFISESIRV